MTISLPFQFDKYTVLKHIGAGGFGEVYQATDNKLGRTVALKFIRKDLLADQEGQRRFEAEGQRAAQIIHPNVVTVFDADEAPGIGPFIAMEYMEGPSLERLLKEQPNQRLPVDKARAMFEDICAGLDAVHSTGQLHRDIKPANILLTHDGRAKLSDFGLAAALITSYYPTERRKYVLGTAGFIAPEVEEGKGYSIQSDIYALGQLLYVMLIGRVRHFDDPPLHQLIPQLPPAVTAVIHKAMSGEPGKRFASAGEMAKAFKEALQQPTSVKQTAPLPKQPRRGSLVWASLAVIAMVVATIIILPRVLPRDPQPAATTIAQAPTATPDAAATAATDATRIQIAVNATRTADATNAPSATPAPTDTPAPTATPAPTETPTVTPTETPRPTATSTSTATMSPSRTPTPRPTETSSPTPSPSFTPTNTPDLKAQGNVAASASGTGDLAFGPVEEISPVESSHPYESNLDKSWYISNDSGFNAMQIYFSRIEIEDGVDLIHITDPDGGLLQEITASHPDGLWSQILPGSGAYVVLKTDSADVRWGFEVDAMAAGNYTTLARSPHPYPDNYDGFVVLYNTEANPPGTRVVFDRIELEDGVDYIIISDVEGNPYQWITGRHPNGLTSKAIPGLAIEVRLVSDGSVQAWGYNVKAVETANPDKPETGPNGRVVLAESDHRYRDRYERTWTLVNPDLMAQSSKVHFSRIDTERGSDVIDILDGNETLIQRLTGQDSDRWTDYVPGKVVKIRFTTDGSNVGWGFQVDSIASSIANPGLAQSDHPYHDRLSRTWSLTNPDATAKSSKIHLNWIDTESGSDVIDILDSSNTVIQRLSGRHVDLWSDYVPGRVVKVRFTTDGSNVGWGFRVDEIASSVANPGLAQSDHPYNDRLSQDWALINPDLTAQASRIHFTQIDTEPGSDIIEILDSSDTVIQRLSGRHIDLWSDYVPGRVVKVRFTTDGSNVGWGFRIDLIESK